MPQDADQMASFFFFFFSNFLFSLFESMKSILHIWSLRSVVHVVCEFVCVRVCVGVYAFVRVCFFVIDF